MSMSPHGECGREIEGAIGILPTYSGALCQIFKLRTCLNSWHYNVYLRPGKKPKLKVLSSMRLITFLELLTSGHTATAALTEGALTSMKQRTLFPYSIMGSMLRLWPEGSLPRPDRLDGLVTETNV